MVVGIDPGDRSQVYLIQLIVLVLLAIVCGNVGTLILARTATRSGEIAIRTALGASRARIVSQLFVEALVLAVASAGLGLVLGDQFGKAFARRAFVEAPFWFDLGVRPKTAALALSVAVFCALIAGVVPALKSTGRAVQRSLQNARAGSSVRFGGASTVLIVAEVAMAVGFLIVGATLSSALVAGASVKADIEPSEYLMAMLRVPWTDHRAVENDLSVAEFRNEVVADHLELARRLAAEPGVRGVAMGNRLPVMEHPTRRVEVDGDDRSEGFEGHRVRIATVDVGFFSGLDAPIVNGRDFNTADLVGAIDTDRTAVIVNTAFVRHVLGDRNPLGQRIRYVRPEDQEPGPWYEIVGVVGHLGMNELDPTNDDGMYHPGAPGEIHPIFMAIHVGADPLSFTPRLREIARVVDPQAMIQYVFPLEDAPNGDRQVNQYSLVLLLFLAAIAITLSGAGLYALMSFTVSQRTREIGIRTALGGQPGQIVLVIVRRAFLQLAAGVAAGALLGVWLLSKLVGGAPPGEIDPAMVVVASAAFMFFVGMLACVVPTIRGLRVRPVEALKEG